MLQAEENEDPTTQSGWHQVKFGDSRLPTAGTRGSEEMRGRGSAAAARLLAASRLKVFQNPQAVSRAAEPPGMRAPVGRELGRA